MVIPAYPKGTSFGAEAGIQSNGHGLGSIPAPYDQR